MSAFKIPAPDAPAEEWGRLAVSLPGWRWMPGMLGRNEVGGADRIMDHTEASQPNLDLWPDPDDFATAGCLLALLGLWVRQVLPARWEGDSWRIFWQDPAGNTTRKDWATGSNLSRACIAAAAALGRWPGGAS